MNLFQLVLKQMRQRSLSTWLTMLSVVLGVALAVAVMILQREGKSLFGQNEFGYQLLIGPKGSPLQLTLNTVYQLDKSPGNIPYALYEELLTSPKFRPLVKVAVPYAVGDTYKGQRIIGTIPQLFGYDDAGEKLPTETSVMEYRPGKRFEFGQGRVFHPKRFEAVIGSEVTKLTGLKPGDKFKATHGLPSEFGKADEHNEEWEVVGVLAPTRTAADKNLFIPLITFYTIEDHSIALQAHDALRKGEDPNKVIKPQKPNLLDAMKPTPATKPADDHDDHGHGHPATATSTANAEDDHAGHDHHDHNYHVEPDGTIDLHLPKDQWEVSVVLIRTRSPFAVRSLQYTFNNSTGAMAINPAEEMTNFFRVFLEPSSNVLLLISMLVTIVATIAILVSIYNSVSARLREIAILRALGATRQRILAIICLEAGLIGFAGGVLGLIAGHLLAAAGSAYTQRVVGEPINWIAVGRYEWLFLLAVTVVAVLAGLVPALKAYRTPVATNLVAG
jgi:putative ABC transport system permease protein